MRCGKADIQTGFVDNYLETERASLRRRIKTLCEGYISAIKQNMAERKIKHKLTRWPLYA